MVGLAPIINLSVAHIGLVAPYAELFDCLNIAGEVGTRLDFAVGSLDLFGGKHRRLVQGDARAGVGPDTDKSTQ